MPHVVDLPPQQPLLADGARLGGWWHEDAEPGRIVCDLCPRDCRLRPGDRGFCFVRENRDGQMALSTYGKSTGFCIDPIEKKPLNQFYPGTSVLSFGTAGCNLGCKFCQNWSISKSREIEQLSENASPEAVARAAQALGCHSVAFTYNDPVIWAEYAIDTARACREAGIKTVAVTAGYITAAARPAFYEFMDAANVDLKGFTEDFYRHQTLSHLEPVKQTLQWLVHESSVWTEITNLIIPRANDSEDELRAMCDWILEALGPNVPVHFTAFHPDFRMTDRPRTPAETLLAAHDIATRSGLNYVYVGNIQAEQQQTTHCPSCRSPVIGRSGYTITRYDLAGGRCRHCGTAVAGHYQEHPGDWGSRRQPVRISQFETARMESAGPPQPKMSSRPVTISDSPQAASTERPLAQEQQRVILAGAVRVLAEATSGRQLELTHSELGAAGELTVLGAFVSLKRGGKLRSCCGFLGKQVALATALAHAARRTACEDPRFPPVALRELAHLDVEVWLLANQQAVAARGADREAAVIVGRHGLQIARGQQRGLLLPGVAIDHGLSAAEFLEHVCLKAELPPTAWREDDTELSTFEGERISGRVAEFMNATRDAAASPIAAAELPALAEFCRGNLLAHLTGATPNYFAVGLPDGNVHGLILTLLDSAGQNVVQANRLSLKTSLPLQSTLFALTENVAAALQQARLTPDVLRQSRVILSVLHEPALHGTVAAPELAGIEPQQHMVIVTERQRTAAVFDPSRTARQLVAAAAQMAEVARQGAAQVATLECVSGMPAVAFAQIPRPAAGAEVRPAAVAGRFYPADAARLTTLVEDCLPAAPRPPEAWPALMVPHAGLIYSGRIAAQTLSRVRIPKTVIVIGPKHTPHGVEYAVAPHAAWSIPGATLAGEPALARQLCEAIGGWQLDAAAHASEHAIEVELPLLARLAPQAKIVGVALGAADWDRCRQFAAGLARLLSSLSEPPLLVISSDMNHFASDAENRRLDEIALAAMETLDPEHVYRTVTAHRISMCGLVPAVVVMEALRELSQLRRAERVAYATSAEVSGDTSRVVGYAGMLLGG
jgi:AmmeMemoRadiSam system radical SAM enzyme/AmmeMemoRadiSam system protein B/AmmeMemoRadiSam system protein A